MSTMFGCGCWILFDSTLCSLLLVNNIVNIGSSFHKTKRTNSRYTAKCLCQSQRFPIYAFPFKSNVTICSESFISIGMLTHYLKLLFSCPMPIADCLK